MRIVTAQVYQAFVIGKQASAKRVQRQANAAQQQTKGQPNMTQGAKCRIWWDETISAYRISTPYSPQFVDFLKIGIPVSDRAYDPSTKIWTFTEKFFDLVESTARKVWKNQGEVVIITKTQSQKASAPPAVATASLDTVMLEFVKILPERALLQAFRFAANELHPDKGGSMESMSKLNTLWDRIKTDKGFK